jgi:hypothetical protein
MQAPDEAPGASRAEQAAPAHGTAGSGRPGTGVAARPGVQRARRAAEWGKQKYAGSWAEYLWNRLNAVDFINQGMLVVFSFFFSGMVLSENNEYGPIGTIFAVMTFLIVIGVVIILGAVVGLVWQERGLSFAAAFRKLRRAS